MRIGARRWLVAAVVRAALTVLMIELPRAYCDALLTAGRTSSRKMVDTTTAMIISV